MLARCHSEGVIALKAGTFDNVVRLLPPLVIGEDLLSEGLDVYSLANQMGTSVKMIEEHYGHITPVKNADRILQGMPGWEPITAAPQIAEEAGRVDAATAIPQAAKRNPKDHVTR